MLSADQQDRIDNAILDYLADGGPITYCPTRACDGIIDVRNQKTVRSRIPRFSKTARGDRQDG